jgi:uncharacterized protein (TIGR00303 family)
MSNDEKTQDVVLAHNESKGKSFLNKLKGKNPIFICAMGTTQTAKIQGISAAGQNPELTDYTPPADVELLLLGKCKSIQGVPITPDGIPTPALITMSGLNLSSIPTLPLNAGLVIKPQIPFLDVGAEPGRDMRTGKAVSHVEEVLTRAKKAGEILSRTADYLIIGESIPGGTTTALGVLLAMGIDAKWRVSSSMPGNPHELRNEVVEEGLRVADVHFGELKKDPLRAITCVGDPMVPAFAGLVVGAASNVPVLMAGGTQMTAVLAVVKALDHKVLRNVAIGTTRWITEDKTSDIRGIVDQIADVPIIAANLNFSVSHFPGLRAYETGIVKEGVGVGGVSIAAMVKSNGAITCDKLLIELEKNYERFMDSRS